MKPALAAEGWVSFISPAFSASCSVVPQQSQKEAGFQPLRLSLSRITTSHLAEKLGCPHNLA
jgi:hypothetical protein